MTIFWAFKMILMKRLLKDKYDIIDSQMSDSNIGGRRNKMMQDHIFVRRSVIQDVLKNSQKDATEIQCFDLRQSFDSIYIKDILI